MQTRGKEKTLRKEGWNVWYNNHGTTKKGYAKNLPIPHPNQSSIAFGMGLGDHLVTMRVLKPPWGPT